MWQDGKTYPLCPLCYNYPPFEGVAKVCLKLTPTGALFTYARLHMCCNAGQCTALLYGSPPTQPACCGVDAQGLMPSLFLLGAKWHVLPCGVCLILLLPVMHHICVCVCGCSLRLDLAPAPSWACHAPPAATQPANMRQCSRGCWPVRSAGGGQALMYRTDVVRILTKSALCKERNLCPCRFFAAVQHTCWTKTMRSMER
jgi:hypothetical protein